MKTDKIYSVSLSYEAIDGHVEISERGEEALPPRIGYSSTTMVKCDVNDATLQFCYDVSDGLGRCEIAVNAFHVTNSETDRTFHGMVSVYPSWRQVEQLRDFCNFLLLARG